MNIYLATSMGGTPFTHIDTLQILSKHNCVITPKIKNADVVVAHNHKHLLPHMILYPKKRYLVWTNEPRFDTNFANEFTLPFSYANSSIMNVYGNDVFWNNLHFLGSYHFDNRNNLGIDIWNSVPRLTREKSVISVKKNKVAALFTNTLGPKTILTRDGINIDLKRKRCLYAMYGNSRNILDIYGSNWPNGIAVANTGYGFEKQNPWWVDKIETLKHYRFNLCMENTAFGYYTTEKIWHSILSNCLPVYSSFNSNIYETFPKESFLDTESFSDQESLFDYIQSMKLDEYLERMNQCIDTYNSSLILKRENYAKTFEIFVDRILKRLES